MVLSPRLAAIAQFINTGEKVADIGTDHAMIPIYLVKKGVSPSSIATDINEGPLRAALEAVCQAELNEKIEILQGDGMDPIKYRNDIDTVVIAGMGGENIIGILSRAFEEQGNIGKLVLQPMNDADLVRAWLDQQGWAITDEELVREGTHFYEIIAANKAGAIKQLTQEEIFSGPALLSKRHPLLLSHVYKQLTKTEQAIEGMSKAGLKPPEYFMRKKVTLQKVIAWLSAPRE